MEMQTPLKTISGFSLIEMIIVIMVISIIGGSFALITYQPYPIELTALANQLASDLRYTQSLSMTKGVRYRLQSINSNQYQILNQSGTPIMLAMGTTTMTMGGGITFGTATNIPNSLVAFDGWGAPYTDTANTALAATGTIVLQTATGQTQTVTVLPVTGRVTVP